MTASACGSCGAPVRSTYTDCERCAERLQLREDAWILAQAVHVLRSHSTRPRSFTFRILCGVLEGTVTTLKRKANSL